TRLLDYEQAASRAAAFVDRLDTVSFPLALRMRGTVAWSTKHWSLNASVNYADDYTDPANRKSVDSWTTVNAGASYRFDGEGPFGGTTLQLSGLNVFDRDPPFVNRLPAAYDSANANQIGRSVSLSVTKSW